MTIRLALGAFIAATALLTAAASATGDDGVSALLKRQTEAFSDAGQRGDTAAMARELDPQVIFTAEDGTVSGRSDFLGGGPSAPHPGVSSTITVTQWVLHRTGNVAVAGFVDDQIVHFHRQVLHYQFRSTETWIKRGATYAVSPDYTVTITRSGNALFASTNGRDLVLTKVLPKTS